jgi:hypothetical protein
MGTRLVPLSKQPCDAYVHCRRVSTTSFEPARAASVSCPDPGHANATLTPRTRFRLHPVHRRLAITTHRDSTSVGREVASLLESRYPDLVRHHAVFASTTAGRQHDTR